MTRAIGRARGRGPDRQYRIMDLRALLLRDVTPPDPYWPGGAAILDDGADPQPIGLLDAMPANALQ